MPSYFHTTLSPEPQTGTLNPPSAGGYLLSDPEEMVTVKALRLLTLALACLPVAPLAAQQDSVLQRRWVGTHLERPLTIEFYGDTMLVVGDRHALTYHLTPDSIVAFGDTSFAVRYRLSHGRLLLETYDGALITMSYQPLLGRPLTGRWVGDLDTAGVRQLAEIELTVDRSARWRTLPGGRRATGEWDRQTRRVTLTWEDGVEWNGLYDPQGNTLLLEPVADSTGAVKPGGAAGILRRAFR